MNELLYSSISEGSTTSTDYSVEVSDDEHLKIKQGNSVKKSETQVLEFEDSRAVREAVYHQWLLEKKAKIKEKVIKETKSKSQIQEEEAKVIAKKEQLKVDTAKAYDKWKTKKDEELAKKTKAKQEEKGI